MQIKNKELFKLKNILTKIAKYIAGQEYSWTVKPLFIFMIAMLIRKPILNALKLNYYHLQRKLFRKENGFFNKMVHHLISQSSHKNFSKEIT